MCYSVVIVSHHLGRTVQILKPGDELLASPGVRLSLALETDSHAEAACAAELIERRLRGERRPVPEADWRKRSAK